MGKLLSKVGLFLGPLLLVLSASELYLRTHNTFYYKAKYLEAHRADAEVLFLGSSHTHRAVNPEQMDIQVLNLANGGSAMNLDYKLALRVIPELPGLKLVVLELSYQSLERQRGTDYSKNNLYRLYYGIDNYEGGMPLWDHFLLSSNFREYVKLIGQDLLYPKKINGSGFMEVDPGPIKSRFAFRDFDTTLIRETSRNYLGGRHQDEDLEVLASNVEHIRDIQGLCAGRGIQLVLLSPPKYYLYNEANRQRKLQRRDSVAQMFMREGVPFWNDERAMEHEVRYFANEDHLNPDGAAVYTAYLGERIQALPVFSAPVGRVRQVVD